MKINPDSRIVVGLADHVHGIGFRTDHRLVQVDDDAPFVAGRNGVDSAGLAARVAGVAGPDFEAEFDLPASRLWRPYAEFSGRQLHDKELLAAVCDEAVKRGEPASRDACEAVGRSRQDRREHHGAGL